MAPTDKPLTKNIDPERGPLIRQSVEGQRLGQAFSGPALAALEYAAQMTRDPGRIEEGDIEALRQAGLSDGEILEINQVTAYFAYVNRTVLGLGISLDGEVLGHSPSEQSDSDDWSHR